MKLYNFFSQIIIFLESKNFYEILFLQLEQFENIKSKFEL